MGLRMILLQFANLLIYLFSICDLEDVKISKVPATTHHKGNFL